MSGRRPPPPPLYDWQSPAGRQWAPMYMDGVEVDPETAQLNRALEESMGIASSSPVVPVVGYGAAVPPSEAAGAAASSSSVAAAGLPDISSTLSGAAAMPSWDEDPAFFALVENMIVPSFEDFEAMVPSSAAAAAAASSSASSSNAAFDLGMGMAHGMPIAPDTPETSSQGTHIVASRALLQRLAAPPTPEEGGAAQAAVDTRPARRKRRAGAAAIDDDDVDEEEQAEVDSDDVAISVLMERAGRGRTVNKSKAKTKPKPPSQQAAASPAPAPAVAKPKKSKAKARPSPPVAGDGGAPAAGVAKPAAAAAAAGVVVELPSVRMDRRLTEVLAQQESMPLVFRCYVMMARAFGSRPTRLFGATPRETKKFVVPLERPLSILLRYALMAETEPLAFAAVMLDQFMANTNVTLMPMLALCNTVAAAAGIPNRGAWSAAEQKAVAAQLVATHDPVYGLYAWLVDQAASTSKCLFDVAFDQATNTMTLQNRCFFQRQADGRFRWEAQPIMADDQQFLVFRDRFDAALHAVATMLDSRFVQPTARGMANAVATLDNDERGQYWARLAAPALGCDQVGALRLLRMAARAGQVDPARLVCRAFDENNFTPLNEAFLAFNNAHMQMDAGVTYVEALTRLAATDPAAEFTVATVLRQMRRHFALTANSDAVPLLGERLGVVEDDAAWGRRWLLDNVQAQRPRRSLVELLQCPLTATDLTPFDGEGEWKQWAMLRSKGVDAPEGFTARPADRAYFTRRIPSGASMDMADALATAVLYHDDPAVVQRRQQLVAYLKAQDAQQRVPGITKKTKDEVFTKLFSDLQAVLVAEAAAVPPALPPRPASAAAADDDYVDDDDMGVGGGADDEPSPQERLEAGREAAEALAQQARDAAAERHHQEEMAFLAQWSPGAFAAPAASAAEEEAFPPLSLEEVGIARDAHYAALEAQLGQIPLSPLAAPQTPNVLDEPPAPIDWANVDVVAAPGMFNGPGVGGDHNVMRVEITHATLANWDRIMADAKTRSAARLMDVLTALSAPTVGARTPSSVDQMSHVFTRALRQVFFQGREMAPSLLYGEGRTPRQPFGAVGTPGERFRVAFTTRVQREQAEFKMVNPASASLTPEWTPSAVATTAAALAAGSKNVATGYNWFFDATMQTDSKYLLHHFLSTENRAKLHDCAMTLVRMPAQLREIAHHVVNHFGEDMFKRGGLALVGLAPDADTITLSDVLLYLLQSVKQLIALFNGEMTTRIGYDLGSRTLLQLSSTGEHVSLFNEFAEGIRPNIVGPLRACLVDMLDVVHYIASSFLPIVAVFELFHHMYVRHNLLPPPPPHSPAAPSTPQTPGRDMQRRLVGTRIDDDAATTTINTDGAVEWQLRHVLTRPVFMLAGSNVSPNSFLQWYHRTHVLSIMPPIDAVVVGARAGDTAVEVRVADDTKGPDGTELLPLVNVDDEIRLAIHVPRVMNELLCYGAPSQFNAQAHGIWTIIELASGRAMALFTLLADSSDGGLGATRYGEALQKAVVVTLSERLYRLQLMRPQPLLLGVPVDLRMWAFSLHYTTERPHALTRELPLARVGIAGELMLFTPSQGRQIVQSHVLVLCERFVSEHRALATFYINKGHDQLATHTIDRDLRMSLPYVHLRARVDADGAIQSVEVMRSAHLERLGVARLTLDMFADSTRSVDIELGNSGGASQLILTGLRIPSANNAIYYAVRLVNNNAGVGLDALLQVAIEVLDASTNQALVHHYDLLHVTSIGERLVAVPFATRMVPLYYSPRL